MQIEGGEFTVHFQIQDGKVNPHTIEKQDNDYNDVEVSEIENEELVKDCQNYYNEMMYVKRQYLAEKANGYLDKPEN